MCCYYIKTHFLSSVRNLRGYTFLISISEWLKLTGERLSAPTRDKRWIWSDTLQSATEDESKHIDFKTRLDNPSLHCSLPSIYPQLCANASLTPRRQQRVKPKYLSTYETADERTFLMAPCIAWWRLLWCNGNYHILIHLCKCAQFLPKPIH